MDIIFIHGAPGTGESSQIAPDESTRGRITARAAMSAKGFYQRLGYTFKDGIEALDERDEYRMAKDLSGKANHRDSAQPPCGTEGTEKKH